MTALKEYDRLEASGLWRATPEDQRREVIVSIGEATLTISDLKDTALAHWSLAAVERVNPDETPAVYSPDGDPGETLEFAENETEMVAAIEKLRHAIDRARPRPGRLRLFGFAGTLAIFVALLVFWLPGALVQHTVDVVPEVKRQAIGEALLGQIDRVAGRSCSSADTVPVLSRLARRTGVRKLVILPTGVTDSAHLPGGIVLVNKSLIEDHEDPAVLAGYILVENVRRAMTDPLGRLLTFGGPMASFQLLTTGEVAPETLESYAEHVLVAPRTDPRTELMLAEFAKAAVPTPPYAFARDVTGESVLDLIEANPMAGQNPDPVLRDRDWVLLQNICGG